MSKIVIKKKVAKEQVGYKRPPKAHQFKPGQSGNPRGRPRGAPSLQELMTKEAARLVKVKQGERVESVSKLSAVVRRVFAQAVGGDLAAARLIFQLSADPSGSEESVSDVTMPDDDVIQRMMKRFEHLTSSKGSKS